MAAHIYVLSNSYCEDQPYPNLCPKNWQYIDKNRKWKYDFVLEVDCGDGKLCN